MLFVMWNCDEVNQLIRGLFCFWIDFKKKIDILFLFSVVIMIMICKRSGAGGGEEEGDDLLHGVAELQAHVIFPNIKFCCYFYFTVL